MNLIYLLIEEFFKEEWVYAVGILTTSVLLTLIRANGLSTTISKLITALQQEYSISYLLKKIILLK